jgi:hypothetical protein
MIPAENPASFGTQNAIAKSTKAVLIRRIARLVRQDGLDYEAWRYVAKKVRQVCRLKPAKRGRKLPKSTRESLLHENLPDDESGLSHEKGWEYLLSQFTPISAKS